MPQLFLVNVGVNASHSLKSPRFSDGSFELVPIPELVQHPGPPMRRYEDVPSRSGAPGGLLHYIPSSYHQRYCHFDPEFVTRTYGDNPELAPRAAALKRAQPGDWLFFLARLWDWHEGTWTGPSSFYIVAALEVASIVQRVGQPPEQDELAIYGANAHVLRAQADSALWDRFWVLKGTPRSQLLPYAIEVTADMAKQVLRDKDGKPWTWLEGRSELQTIGSYTRSIRVVADTESRAFRDWPAALRAIVQ